MTTVDNDHTGVLTTHDARLFAAKSREKLRLAEDDFRKEILTLQEKCPHDYVLSQIAGEGFTCAICKKWKPEDSEPYTGKSKLEGAA